MQAFQNHHQILHNITNAVVATLEKSVKQTLQTPTTVSIINTLTLLYAHIFIFTIFIAVSLQHLLIIIYC